MHFEDLLYRVLGSHYDVNIILYMFLYLSMMVVNTQNPKSEKILREKFLIFILNAVD